MSKCAQASSQEHTTTCDCEIGGCVHANNTLKCGKLDATVLHGLEEVLRHRIFGLGQVVELNPALFTTISVEEAVDIVVVRLDCDRRLHRGIIPRGCRSWGVSRSAWRGRSLCNCCAGSLGCRWAIALIGRGHGASALPGRRHFGKE